MDTISVPLRLEARSPSWPDLLRHIDAPPEALWVRGRISLLGRAPRVAVVGTRAPTPYGEAQASRFASVLARSGVTVVSGLARGIDQAAHRAALDEDGATIAVLGCGVDRPWPSGEVADAVASRGILLSEFEPGQPPRPHHFPMRNRVISGLCDGVLVVEAAQASGSLITARWAVDQGRSVWALPGRVDHPMSRGTHRLIREGASLVEGPEEILAELGFAPETAEPRVPLAAIPRPLQEILDALRGETLTAEELSRRLSRSLATVLVQVVELEMAGRVARTPGGLYRLLKPQV